MSWIRSRLESLGQPITNLYGQWKILAAVTMVPDGRRYVLVTTFNKNTNSLNYPTFDGFYCLAMDLYEQTH